MTIFHFQDLKIFELFLLNITCSCFVSDCFLNNFLLFFKTEDICFCVSEHDTHTYFEVFLSQFQSVHLEWIHIPIFYFLGKFSFSFFSFLVWPHPSAVVALHCFHLIRGSAGLTMTFWDSPAPWWF